MSYQYRFTGKYFSAQKLNAKRVELARKIASFVLCCGFGAMIGAVLFYAA